MLTNFEIRKGALLSSTRLELEVMDEVYIDPRCECDAPRFVDFTNITAQYDDNADEWFGKPESHRISLRGVM